MHAMWHWWVQRRCIPYRHTAIFAREKYRQSLVHLFQLLVMRAKV